MLDPTPVQLADSAWCEAQYNPRLAIPDPAGKLKEWATQAAATRARLAHRTIAYGAHPREAFDLFPAEDAKGLLAYIHGGYWRAQHKDDFSWVADAFVPLGYSVAVITYPLCPEVTVESISGSCRNAVATLWREAKPSERANFVLTGHSAGGYLVAAMLAADWTAPLGMPPGKTPFRHGVSYSGVFELAPLLNTTMNELIRLTPAQAREWSLHERGMPNEAPLILAYGADEPGEFHRQSLQQSARWKRTAVAIEKANHFSIVEQLRQPGSQVFDLTLMALES